MENVIFDFTDIAPYENDAFRDAIERISSNPQLLEGFLSFITKKHDLNGEKIRLKLSEVNNYTDFQREITAGIFIPTIVNNSIDNFTYGGFENLKKEESYVFISNHRDIVLDTALLDYALFKNGLNMCEMVIGDNLLKERAVADLLKVNGAVTVKRCFESTTELRNETLRLSHYMTDAVTNRKKSLWIAQKSGRSKDGIDNTSPAILKMLYLASREKGVAFRDFLAKVKIVPVAVSYQYDPCDVTKSLQELGKIKAEEECRQYIKKRYSDVIDMVRGLRMTKGNVHLQIGTPLSSTVENPRDASSEIDKQIHKMYKLWNTNYIAWDCLNNSNRFNSCYSEDEYESFVTKHRGFSEEVRKYVLGQYANPVQSMLNEEN